MNKTISVKCEVKQKTKDETFILELTQDKSKKIQKNATKLELHTRYSGTFRCVVQNQVSKKMAEKVITCSGKKIHFFQNLLGRTHKAWHSCTYLQDWSRYQEHHWFLVPSIASLQLPQLLGANAAVAPGTQVTLSAWHSPVLSHLHPLHPAAACPTATLIAFLL